MNELKTEDVMRALEICVDTEDSMCCHDCPYYRNEPCVHRLNKDALALLREKDAEIERLKKLHEGFATKFKAEFKADAITEFVEKLKERMREVYPADIYDSDVDQIANELKEKANEQM